MCVLVHPCVRIRKKGQIKYFLFFTLINCIFNYMVYDIYCKYWLTLADFSKVPLNSQNSLLITQQRH